MKKRKLSSGTKWLVVLGVLCIAFLAYDFTSGFGLNLGNEGLVANTDTENPGSIPEPDAAEGAAEPGKTEDGAAKDDADASAKEDSPKTEEGAAPTQGSDYYSKYQTEKEQVRSQEIAMLNEVVNNPNSSKSGKEDAEARVIAISKRMEDEVMIAALLAAKDFSQSAAFIQDEKVTVVVSGELNDNEVQQIADLVDGVTGVGISNVVIIPKN